MTAAIGFDNLVAVRWVGLMLVVAGCGRLGYDRATSDSDSDATVAWDATATRDAAVARDAVAEVDAGCAMWGPFSAPVQLPEFAGGRSDWLSSLTADERTIVLSPWDGATGNDLYWTSRAAGTGLFEVPTGAISELNQSGHDSGGHLSVDELRIYFASDRPGTLGSPDLWVASRTNIGAPFSATAHLGAINSSAIDDSPHLSTDELRIYFESRRSGPRNLYVASRDDLSSPFSAAVAMSDLNSTANERGVTLTADELTAMFPSTRPSGLGGYDLWLATRPDRTSPFGTPVNVAELNTPFDDVYPHLSADGARVYFNYDTALGGGRDADVWVADRSCVAQ